MQPILALSSFTNHPQHILVITGFILALNGHGLAAYLAQLNGLWQTQNIANPAIGPISVINIIEIQQKMTQGITQPFLCRGDDDQRYIVKRLNATLEGCINEWVAARLGQAFGLPVPDCKLVYISEQLIEVDKELQFELGEGIAFASHFLPDLQEMNYQSLLQLPIPSLMDLFLFDYWIQNSDRTLTEKGGNPNLFFRHSSDLQPVVLDHNLAFERDFDLPGFRRSHLAAPMWLNNTDMLIRDTYESKMARALNSLPEILQAIADDWRDGLADADGTIARMQVVLNRFTIDEFWEGLL